MSFRMKQLFDSSKLYEAPQNSIACHLQMPGDTLRMDELSKINSLDVMVPGTRIFLNTLHGKWSIAKLSFCEFCDPKKMKIIFNYKNLI
jgi:hypothetical protein